MVSDETVLSGLGYHCAERIGAGAEANVYAISNNKVLRLLKTEDKLAELEINAALLSKIYRASTYCTFETPQIERIISFEDRYGTIEKRLPGCSLSSELRKASGSYRATLIQAWLDASLEVATIDLGDTQFRDMGRVNSAQFNTFHDYWTNRLSESLSCRRHLFDDIDAKRIATALPEPNKPSLVHLDLYSDNILWYQGKVSSILDFGFCTVAGDDKLSPLFAAVYATYFIINPQMNDNNIVQNWLMKNSLSPYFERAKLMMAAFWSFVDDDLEMEQWCRENLLTHT